jgi:hypothetical protein
MTGGRKVMTRYRLFSYVAIGAGVWFWIPGWIFQGLSAFSWVCWIWPSELLFSFRFGVEVLIELGRESGCESIVWGYQWTWDEWDYV